MRTSQRTPFGVFQSTAACQACHGTGKIVKDPCPDCHGGGQQRKQRTIQVKIPAGIDDGNFESKKGFFQKLKDLFD